MRLIDADLLKENWKYNFDHKRRLVELFDEQPTVEAVPVVHGKWNDYGVGVICSNCGNSLFHQDENNNAGIEPSGYNYCPNCGARMDGE